MNPRNPRRVIIDDIRRNLTPIFGHLSMLIDGDESLEDFRKRADMLLSRAQSINSAVNRLERLTWSTLMSDALLEQRKEEHDA